MESKFEEKAVEVLAIIRRHKFQETKKMLSDAGYDQMTFYSIHGRGKQKGRGGLANELDPGLDLINKNKDNNMEMADNDYHFLPKRMLSLVIPESAMSKVLEIIININKTGFYGDGKIFVIPVGFVERIRTSEEGLYALA
ncbi:MAG: P-II family nitrogen regulator [Deltaproteobacteria bacterium]|jgi:nitrogen regulatory protein PII 2|uniref:P-II family nitrogen regulator n=1 Tax=Candidatus Acididesulfobacter diazotrophicus TaxID=2597226 RepID=A0A519BKY8_9DELT|nr:P-II family nitrogen regulator [Deltaproteobacteria bacterium]RZD17941.1 MAG: P-II family nitrogen regulator [Candidatus Acididesulfobacter diazotrophicus]